MGAFTELLKKIFSISLLFTSLVTIACALQIILDSSWFSIYWQPIYGYFLNGAVFLVAILAAALNIYPSRSLAKQINTGRLFFHHYVYGLMIIFISTAFLNTYAPVSMLNVFFVYSTDLSVNAGRFFVLAGLAMFIDDLPDVSKKIDHSLNWLKGKFLAQGKIIQDLQTVSGVALFVIVLVFLIAASSANLITVSTLILIVPMLVTSILSMFFSVRRDWLTAN